MSVSMQGTIDIDVEAWIEFLKGQAGFEFPKGAFFRFGPVVDNGDFISVEFALGEETSPANWSKPPEWLKKETPK